MISKENYWWFLRKIVGGTACGQKKEKTTSRRRRDVVFSFFLPQTVLCSIVRYSKILNKRGARLSAELAVRRLLRTLSPARSVAYYGPRPQRRPSVRRRPPKKFDVNKRNFRESSETRFHQVSRLYDLISGGKRLFKVSHF